MFGLFAGLFIKQQGIRIRTDLSVTQVYDPCGVLLGQLRVMRHHDHQPVFGYLTQQIHDLYAGVAVQRAGGFIGQQDIRIIHQSAGDRHPLHLSAGHLIGFLVKLFSQAHFLQSFFCSAGALCLADTGDSQRQFHVGQDSLMGNQVIALKHETDGVVAVRVPVPVLILSGGYAVDDQVAAVIPVQSADDI